MDHMSNGQEMEEMDIMSATPRDLAASQGMKAEYVQREIPCEG